MVTASVVQKPRQRLVDGVVHHLVDQVVQAVDGGVADVHAGALAHRFKAFEDCNRRCAVLRLAGGRRGLGRGFRETVQGGYFLTRDPRCHKATARVQTREITVKFGPPAERFQASPGGLGAWSSKAFTRSKKASLRPHQRLGNEELSLGAHLQHEAWPGKLLGARRAEVRPGNVADSAGPRDGRPQSPPRPSECRNQRGDEGAPSRCRTPPPAPPATERAACRSAPRP